MCRISWRFHPTIYSLKTICSEERVTLRNFSKNWRSFISSVSRVGLLSSKYGDDNSQKNALTLPNSRDLDSKFLYNSEDCCEEDSAVSS